MDWNGRIVNVEVQHLNVAMLEAQKGWNAREFDEAEYAKKVIAALELSLKILTEDIE